MLLLEVRVRALPATVFIVETDEPLTDISIGNLIFIDPFGYPR